MAEKQGNDETVDARACVLPHPRVGDAYRELAAEELCGYRAGGFLDQDEFEARRDIILSAKTAAEVEAMFTDLHGSLLPRKTSRPPLPAASPPWDGSFPDGTNRPAIPARRQRMHPSAQWFWAMVMLMGVLAGAFLADVTWLVTTALIMLGSGMLFGGVMAIREVREGKTWKRVDRCD